jgi:hypothetical protein
MSFTRTSILKVFAVFFFLSVLYEVKGQTQISLNENDVDLEIQTWHYDRYPKSKNVQWSVLAKDGVGYFNAEFSFQGDNYIAKYDDDGSILLEKIFIQEASVPQEVIKLLDYRIVKYKLEEFMKYTTFDQRKEDEVFHRVQARTKTGGLVVFWLDSNYKVLPDKKDSDFD